MSHGSRALAECSASEILTIAPPPLRWQVADVDKVEAAEGRSSCSRVCPAISAKCLDGGRIYNMNAHNLDL